MADGFESGIRSAIAGGNTTVIPFALRPRGASLCTSVVDYHEEADGKSCCDYDFRLIISDPSPSVLVVGEPGDGGFLKRSLSPYAVPNGAPAL